MITITIILSIICFGLSINQAFNLQSTYKKYRKTDAQYYRYFGTFEERKHLSQQLYKDSLVFVGLVFSILFFVLITIQIFNN